MLRSVKISDKVFDYVNTAALLFLIAITAYPFIYIISMSFSSSSAIMTNKVTIFPVGFNISAYKKVIENIDFWISYKNTIIYVVLGTLYQLIGTTLLAYPLSKKRLLMNRWISYFAAFTMYFSGGLVPMYLLLNYLHLRNTIWVMILPGFISVFNMIVMRTYFQTSIPLDLEESATIDGMGQFGILTRIYMPLSKPIYATLTLFISVGIWNNYFHAYIFLDDKALFPLQVYLRNLIMDNVVQGSNTLQELKDTDVVVGEAVKASTIIVSMLPIMMVYPFIQKFFIKGIMIGSIKG